MSFPVDNFLADPKVREYPEPDHCLRVRDVQLEVEHLRGPATQPGDESPEPDGEFRREQEYYFALFGEDAPKQPNGQQDKGRAEWSVDMPVAGVRVQSRNWNRNHKRERKHNTPGELISEPAQQGINSIVNLFAGEAPER